MSSLVGEGKLDPTSVEIRVFTLNCWGLRLISSDRKERFEAIGHYLSRGDHDIVFLQEVWNQSDYDAVKEAIQDAFPHSHFFDNGVIGTGTCVFTRVQIHDATLHEFAMNGYPHKITHGDWFGGKGLGVCHIFYKGYDVHLYTSHYHAEYNRAHDIYLGHRVSHALESAQWIKLTSSSADLTIYAGDFNTEPTDVPYRLLRAVAALSDSWLEANGTETSGWTSEIPSNSYTTPRALRECPNGKRIDYIMYRSGPNVLAAPVSTILPLPSRIPNRNFSYSDHEAVCTTLRLQRTENSFLRASEFRRHLSMECRIDCVKAVKDAIGITEVSQRKVSEVQVIYAIVAAVLLSLFVGSFFPIFIVDYEYHAYLDVGLFLPRFFISIALVFFFLMATVFTKKEMNALRSTKASLRLIMDQDLSNNGNNMIS
ncbi:hypothetical protein TCAL_11250 [Tigriopus californicus]|uniref:sphingomyelin phosphodiesterase n=1 Tax=Tigriopus californicus TaxID=6832 RepID=A0A553PAG2_TIGCA|nr:putative neutral sphingomyelinase [Tigriopus californicus]TRY74675.1 hypothetical protein TCAL_11250 [Tigriopus californicus]|eukprot:TCALIF_11250-PA protein Name:"Similar to CG12034 Putative neutral sphingomyelinase (Drosophila melanogaster)" AED:0.11 eAED:0.11 QI:166/1/1/1/1/1/2/258/425